MTLSAFAPPPASAATFHLGQGRRMIAEFVEGFRAIRSQFLGQHVSARCLEFFRFHGRLWRRGVFRHGFRGGLSPSVPRSWGTAQPIIGCHGRASPRGDDSPGGADFAVPYPSHAVRTRHTPCDDLTAHGVCGVLLCHPRNLHSRPPEIIRFDEPAVETEPVLVRLGFVAILSLVPGRRPVVLDPQYAQRLAIQLVRLVRPVAADDDRWPLSTAERDDPVAHPDIRPLAVQANIPLLLLDPPKLSTRSPCSA